MNEDATDPTQTIIASLNGNLKSFLFDRMDETSDVKLDIQSRMTRLLEQEFDDGFSLKDELEDLFDAPIETRSRRFLLDGTRVTQFDRMLWESLLSNPTVALPACETAITDVLSNSDQFPKIAKQLQHGDTIQIGLKGEFGPHLVSPRLLSSLRIHKTVCLIGIVTRATSVRLKLVQSVQYCPKTNEFIRREFRDVTSNEGLPTASTMYPTRDEAGNLLETEYGFCTYVDSQTINMQELPELSPPGAMPRSTEIILEDDLANACKPGDRVYITGILKPVLPKTLNQVRSHIKTVVVGNAVTQTSMKISSSLTQEDLHRIKAIASGDSPLKKLAASFAPSIYGHEMVKRGILLLLFGGVEKTLESRTHLRGDINCLLVGDPGTAKSQLLRAVMEVCPVAISTTGRGSTGVGLTAAVSEDQETGEKRLDAGAMVLGDRGIVCIDEFDKMSDADRVAIHEVMEQQTVTITKSGIKATLNARCSVIAAANPLYGNYDHNISIAKNINMPDSLLSRFDLLFVILDEKDVDHDRRISRFVLQCHREHDVETRIGEAQTVHSWHYRHSTEQQTGSSEYRTEEEDILDPQFLRKYVFYAKQHMEGNIRLTTEASEAIAEYYVYLRSISADSALPVTPRTLETIIRLSTAHAKLRLSADVTIADVLVAREILNTVFGNPEGLTKNEQQWELNNENQEISGTEAGEAPTIYSFIPSKPLEATQAMDVDITNVEDLSEAHKHLIHAALFEILGSKPFGTITELIASLRAHNIDLNEGVLTNYLKWVGENYDERPDLNLPKILFDTSTREFFDVS